VLYGERITARSRVGPVPHLLDPALRDRERAEAEARAASIPPEVAAARELIREEMRQQGRGRF
jgi:hypothetical protein